MARPFLRFAPAAALLLLLALVACLPADGFFSGDAGAKLLQADAIAGCGGPPCEISYPAAPVDPGRELRPSYTARGREGLVSLFPYLYPAIAAPLVPWLGAGRALRLVSALSALFAALLAGALAAPRPGSREAAAVMILFSTPLLFYGAAVWEHAPATLLLVGAVLLVVRGGPDVLSGLLLGLAFWLRTESLVYGGALVLVLAIADRRLLRCARLTAGLCAGLALGAAGQRLLLGSWAPLHLAANPSAAAGLAAGTLGARLRGIVELFAPDAVTGVAALVLCLAPAVAFLARRRRALVLGAGVLALLAAGAAAFAAPAARFWLGAGPAASFPVRAVPGIWLFAAALPLGALVPPHDPRERRIERLLAGAALVPMAAFWLLSPLPGGYQWGGRYFLPSAVLLAVLAWRCLARLRERRERGALVLGAAAVGCAIAVEGLGLALLMHVTAGNAALARRIVADTRADRPLACATRWLPEVLAPAWDERMIVRVDTGSAMRTLVRGLVDSGRQRVDLFTVLEPETDAVPVSPAFCEVLAETVLVTPGRRTRHTVLSCPPARPGRPAIDSGGTRR